MWDFSPVFLAGKAEDRLWDSGGQDWIHPEKFDIDAQSDGEPNVLVMQGPMMELTLGEGSPKLRAFQTGNCTPVRLGQFLPALAAGERYCRNMDNPRGARFEGGTLTMFAGMPGRILNRPAIDKTGLTELAAIDSSFRPTNSLRLRGRRSRPARGRLRGSFKRSRNNRA